MRLPPLFALILRTADGGVQGIVDSERWRLQRIANAMAKTGRYSRKPRIIRVKRDT